jgi:hypothetical protein
LPSRHHLPFSGVKSTIHKLEGSVTDGTIYVVYPSWDFDVSGGCRLTKDQLVIEVVRGDIGPLLRGEKTPEAVYSFEAAGYRSRGAVIGNGALLSNENLSHLLKACRSLSFNQMLVLEWSLTVQRDMVFHDWIEW